MAGPPPQIEWYLARDGQQFGPLSDVEMRKFVELGHLRPTDLVWRQGFPDWRPAPAVFPPRPAPPMPQPAPRRPAPSPQPGRQQPAASPRGMPQPERPADRAPAGRPAHLSRHELSRNPELNDLSRHDGAQRQDPSYPRFDGPTSAQTAVAAADPLHPADIDTDEDEYEEEDERRPRRWRRLLVATLVLAILGGAGWMAATQPGLVTRIMSLTETKPSEPAAETLREAPFQLASDGADEIDQQFQRTALWQILKAEFPDWYAERLKEAVQLKAENRDEGTIARHLAGAVVALRRQHANEALAASPVALRTIAASFLDNLKHLQAESIDACYGYISQGETSPAVLSLMGDPSHVQPLQRQATSVFAAVAEGRRTPQKHLPPRKTDYDVLTSALGARGWTNGDLQLFSNPQALAQATPEQVCRLVQDWFAAQLSITEEDVQTRLLMESLKPVVAG